MTLSDCSLPMILMMIDINLYMCCGCGGKAYHKSSERNSGETMYSRRGGIFSKAM